MSNTQTIAALDLAIQLVTRAAQISTLVSQAQASGRELNPEEWRAINSEDGRERQRLVDAIAQARSEGR